MQTLDEVRKFFQNDVYATGTTGIEIADARPGYAKVTLTIDERHINAVDRVMGAVYYTMADFAFASSAYANGIFTTAINCSIEYLSAGRGSFLTSKGYIDKAGRSIVFGGADVYDETGKMIARLSVQAFRIEKPMV